METVCGIGGIFFRTNNPEALAEWYERHLGVLKVPSSYDEPSWQQQAGPTELAPFDESNAYLSGLGAHLILNFRVRDLDRMVEQLRSAGIAVEVDPERYPNGRFALLRDPEGTPIQLWEVA
jgi:glyoxylase I family protein